MMPIKHRKRFILRHADGRYYSFCDWVNYDGPQFSRDPRDAKQMTSQGCAIAQKMLADPKRHGEIFERVPIEQIAAAPAEDVRAVVEEPVPFNDPLYNAESDARNAAAMLEEVLEWFDDGVGRRPEEHKLLMKIRRWLNK